MGSCDGQGGGRSPRTPPTAEALARAQQRYAERFKQHADPRTVRVGRPFDRTSRDDLAVIRDFYESQDEDYAGLRAPSNLQLVEEAVALCAEVGRPVASPAEAAKLLDLPA